MIFRRQNGQQYTKLYLSLLGLHKVFNPWTVAHFPGCFVEIFLNPTIKNLDWKVYTARGDEIAPWFKKHGRGSMLISCMLGEEVNMSRFGAEATGRVSFTDRNTALMCKLQLGGL